VSGGPALELLDLANKRGLEIGPLYSPRVKKSDGAVYYVDHCSTEELRRSFAANAMARQHLDEIVEVDYVVKEGSTLSATVGADAPFDYVVASHVLEHLANPLGWLEDAEKLLAPDGLVSLVIPDKRFCFDVNRDLTRPQDWADWYLRDLRAPSYSQLFDFFAHVTTIDGMVDTAGIWEGTADYAGVRRSDVPDADLAAWQSCLHYRDTQAYMDVHTGVYTPERFLSLVELGTKAGVLHFEVAHFVPTPRGSLEFYATLRRSPPEALAERLASLGRARHLLADAPAPASPAGTSSPSPSSPSPSSPPGPGGLGSNEELAPGRHLVDVSCLERRMIMAKRRFMQALRSRR